MIVLSDLPALNMPQPDQHDIELTWLFDTTLAEQPASFFLPLLRQHNRLKFEFESLKNQLNYVIQTRKDIRYHQDELLGCLMVAQLLRYHSEHFLSAPHHAQYYEKQIQALKPMLHTLGYQFPQAPAASNITIEHALVKTIKEKTGEYNLFRQLIQRGNKTIKNLGLLVPSLYRFLWLDKINRHVSPALNYLVFLFFLPRTAAHTWLVARQILPGPWLNDREKELTVFQRLEMQLRLHGFGLNDDLIWLMVNVSICFILTGPLSHWAAPMLLFQQFNEMISRMVKLYVEIMPLIRLRQHYQNLLDQTNLAEEEKENLRLYLHFLDQQLNFHTKQHLLDAANSTTIFLLSVLTIALISYSPWVPLATASVMLAATFVFYFLDRYLKKQNPSPPDALIGKVSKLGLFFEPLSRLEKEASLDKENLIETKDSSIPVHGS